MIKSTIEAIIINLEFTSIKQNECNDIELIMSSIRVHQGFLAHRNPRVFIARVGG